MTHTTALPLSLTHAAALARLAELRAEAERGQLARAAARHHHRAPGWPAQVAAVLRDSVASLLPGADASGHRAPCPTC